MSSSCRPLAASRPGCSGWSSPCSGARSSSTWAGSRRSRSTARTCGAAPSTCGGSAGGPGRSWRPSCTASPPGEGRVMDVGIAPSEQRRGGWEVTVLAISQGRSPGPGGTTPRPSCRGISTPSCSRPATLAEQLDPAAGDASHRSRQRGRGHAGRHGGDEVVEALQDEELADLLEEMPEQDQVRLLGLLGLERSGRRRRGDGTRRRRRPARRDAAPSSGNGCWPRWRRCRPVTCAGCFATTRPRQAG